MFLWINKWETLFVGSKVNILLRHLKKRLVPNSDHWLNWNDGMNINQFRNVVKCGYKQN